MGKLPNIVFWVGWDKCLHQEGVKGGHYHPICIWLAFGMWIPRTLLEGKVGLKVGLKRPSSATGPSPFGCMGLRAEQVKIKTWINYQSVCLFCDVAKSPPLPHAH